MRPLVGVGRTGDKLSLQHGGRMQPVEMKVLATVSVISRADLVCLVDETSSAVSWQVSPRQDDSSLPLLPPPTAPCSLTYNAPSSPKLYLAAGGALHSR